VQVNEQAGRTHGELQTLLESLGLNISPVEEPAERTRLENLMGDSAPLLRQAFHVENVRTRRAYERRLAETASPTASLLWHGSRNENWLSILERGLTLRPAHAVITGKMFGYGLYFADRFQKSLNYTSLRGSCWSGGSDHRAFMALYDVHVGRQLKVRTYASWCAELTAKNLTKRTGILRKPYDSVMGKRGLMLQNNEYIVYDEAQCTVRYLLEVAHA
jgi:poly [ADP-ribose] polymerase